MSDKRKIILNNVFPDATYNTGNNLYHETINLFRADDEADDDRKYYIYLNAGGTYKGFFCRRVWFFFKGKQFVYQLFSAFNKRKSRKIRVAV